MPIKKCQIDNKPGFKWGDEGTCYPYTQGNKKERDEAANKAARQGRAIEASKRRHK